MRSKRVIGIGGDLKYLEHLLKTYGKDATVLEVAEREKTNN